MLCYKETRELKIWKKGLARIFSFFFHKKQLTMQTHHRRRSSKSILLPRLSTSNISSGNVANSNMMLNGQPNYARRMTVHLPETIPDTTYLYGYALLFATFLLFMVSFYSIIASKYMPDTNIKVRRVILVG